METLARNELLNFSNQFLSIKTAGGHIYKRFIGCSIYRRFFITFAKSSDNLTFLTPDKHTYVSVLVGKRC